MKQHITIKQLNELSEKGADKMKEWLATKVKGTPVGEITLIDGRLPSPILSIGGMIEFLDDGVVKPHIYKVSRGWVVDEYIYGQEDSIFNIRRKELCDALWEAVKDTLEK